jgi:hypothetical protein
MSVDDLLEHYWELYQRQLGDLDPRTVFRAAFDLGFQLGHWQGEVDEHSRCPEHGYVSCERHQS